jgi:hypothetical protein
MIMMREKTMLNPDRLQSFFLVKLSPHSSSQVTNAKTINLADRIFPPVLGE